MIHRVAQYPAFKAAEDGRGSGWPGFARFDGHFLAGRLGASEFIVEDNRQVAGRNAVPGLQPLLRTQRGVIDRRSIVTAKILDGPVIAVALQDHVLGRQIGVVRKAHLGRARTAHSIAVAFQQNGFGLPVRALDVELRRQRILRFQEHPSIIQRPFAARSCKTTESLPHTSGALKAGRTAQTALMYLLAREGSGLSAPEAICCTQYCRKSARSVHCPGCSGNGSAGRAFRSLSRRSNAFAYKSRSLQFEKSGMKYSRTSRAESTPRSASKSFQEPIRLNGTRLIGNSICRFC